MASLPSWTRPPAIAAAVVALSLGAAACGGSDADDQAGGSESAAGGEVLEASSFSGEATTVDGATFDLGPLANQDLVVWFWAPW